MKIILLPFLLLNLIALSQGPSRVHFEYAINFIDHKESTVTVKCYLNNSSNDTVYFRNYSCSGAEDLIRYDKESYSGRKQIMCNFTMAIVSVIPPGGVFEFVTKIHVKDNSKPLELGFMFMEVFDRNDVKFFNSYEDNPKKTIWAKEAYHIEI